VTLVNTSNTVSGALFLVTIKSISKDFNYLEACFRAYMDGATTPQFLSSGTEVRAAYGFLARSRYALLLCLSLSLSHEFVLQ